MSVRRPDAVFVEHVANLNARRTARTLVNPSEILERMIEGSQVAIIGNTHDLASGRDEERPWLRRHATSRVPWSARGVMSDVPLAGRQAGGEGPPECQRT